MSFIHGQMPLAQRARFGIGVWKARGLGAEIGSRARVDWTTHLLSPSTIRIGAMTEVLRGCTLDGRSRHATGLSIGHRSRLKENCWLACYGGQIRLGKQCLLGRNSVLQGHGGISLGDFSGCGPNCVLLSFEPAYWRPGAAIQDQGFVVKPISIEENVYIGANCTILGGVTIGPNVLIGAGSVVTRDLESGYVYAGAPVRPLRRLEDGERDEQVVHHDT